MCALLLWATPAVALVSADVVVAAVLASRTTVVFYHKTAVEAQTNSGIISE